MKYVKIRAKDYNEAMQKLRSEYGDDAIPISHKYIKDGGFFNSKLFAKELVELTAGVQERKAEPKNSTGGRKFDVTVGDTPVSSKDAVNRLKFALERHGAGKDDENTLDSLNKTIDAMNDNLSGIKAAGPEKRIVRDDDSGYNDTEPLAAKKTDAVQRSDKTEDDNIRADKFEKEFTELKSTLNRLIDEREGVRKGASGESNVLLDKYTEILKDNDFDSDACSSFMAELKNSVSNDDLMDEVKIEKSLKELLKSRIVTTGPLKTGNKKKIVMFVGPTGVGKTTTMAKLGAIHSLREGQKVVFITIDNYRIAATEQLKKYAEIMRIPIYAINDHKEFKSVIAREKADIILIDTSGRSHRNEMKISEIKSFADLIDYDFDKVLCVSANTKKRDLEDIFQSFDVVSYDSVAITKVDETSYIGNVVDVADKYNKPISYFTNGQEVPNDIEVADSDKIVDMMIGNVNK